MDSYTWSTSKILHQFFVDSDRWYGWTAKKIIKQDNDDDDNNNDDDD